MDVDSSLLGSPKPTDSAHLEKENADRNEPDVLLVAKVPTPVLFDQSPDGTPQSPKAEISLEEEKLVAMIRVEQKRSGFGEGVRRESFPGKHLHTPDVSFNCEEAFIGDKSYSSDIAHDDGMSFVYNARSSTPVPAQAIPLPATVRRTKSDSDTGVEPYSDVSLELGSKTPLPLPTTNLKGLDSLAATSPNPQTTCPRSPLAFEIDTDTQGKGVAPSRESGPVPPQHNLSEGAQLKGTPILPVASLKSLSARAAALRFILPEDSLMEMDSILDVQFPGGMEDEFTAAFARLALGSSGNEPKATKPQITTPEPTKACEEQEPPVLDQQEPPVLVGVKSQSGAGSGESAPTPDEADGSYLEDEHTLNIASLGISEFGNTLLMDMSLDQLRSKPNETEHENTTFGGSSFVITTSSEIEWPAGAVPEAQTPKRTASNPLPDVEDRDMSIEATVKKPRSTNGRVVSDVVVDALRSGRALHRVTNSISGVNPAGLINRVDGADGTPLGKPIWPGSTASLRRTESFTSYPGSAAPLQRTRSTMSLRRTSTATSYQPDFIRPHSRASALDFDSDDEQPYTPSIPTMSRGSSRRSSMYALPEPGIPNDHPASYLERPSSVASIYDRPTSAASIRPTSAASIRPTSAASIRTSSTRPTSAASSLRSGSSRRVSGAHIQPSSAEEELVRGMETLMRGDMRKTSHNAQEAQHVRTTKIAGVGVSATRDNRSVTRPGIRQPPGSSAPRTIGMGTKSALGAPKALGSKILSGMPGSKHPVGSGTKSTVTGTGGAKTMSAASGRTASVTTGSGTRSTASTLRSQSSVKSSSTRTRASTLGLFAPDGGPGAGQEPKKPTHKPSSASISATPSTTRTLRPPTTASSVRTLGARGVGAPTVPTRAATTAGSIASLREVMKSKETSKR